MSLKKRLKDAAHAFREGLHPIIFDPGPLKFEHTELPITEVACTYHRSLANAMESEETIRQEMAARVGTSLLRQNLISINTTMDRDYLGGRQIFTARVRVVAPTEDDQDEGQVLWPKTNPHLQDKVDLRVGNWDITNAEKGGQFRYREEEKP